MGKSAESATMQSLLKGTKAAMITSDQPVAIRLEYVGDGTITSVTVTTATDLVLVTSDGGTDTFTFSTFSTIGALADAIDAGGIFQAKVLDALRSDATTGSEILDGAITLSSDGFFDVLSDTSTLLSITYRCAYDRNVKSAIPSGNHRVSLQQIQYLADVGTAAANSVQVWEYDRTNNIETQVYQTDSIDNTNTTLTFASGRGFITAGFNNDLIVRILDAGTLSNTGLFLSVLYERE